LNKRSINKGISMHDKEDVCQIRAINESKVSAVKQQMLDDNIFTSLSDTFKTLGDKTRVKILHALSKEELCVCDISAVLGMSM